MRKIYQFFALAAILLLPCAVGAQTTTMTVADGSATNQYIPVYGYYVDEAQHNQVIYTEDMLDEMVGGTITGMTFYMSETSNSYGNPVDWATTVTISLGSATTSQLSAIDAAASLTQVWQGQWSGLDEMLVVTFANEFTYVGGDLLLDIQTTSGDYGSAYFYGVEQTGASYYSCGSSSNTQNFVPKTTFEYTPGDGQICYRPKNLVISDITNEGATISWTAPTEEGSNYLVFVNGQLVDTPSDTFAVVTGLDANTTHSVSVRNFCAEGDTSGSLNGSFKTDCQYGSCEVQVQMGGYYSPTLHIYQSGGLMADVDGNQTVSICNQDSLIVLYEAPYYSWGSQNIVITDVAGTELYNADASNRETGDTLVAVANGCPSCLPPANLHVADLDTTNITIEWTMNSDVEDYIVYLNGEQVGDPISENTYTFSDLSPSTAYQVAVRANCGNDDTSAFRTLSVATSCGIIVIEEDTPYFEDFDAYTSEEAIPCWGGEAQYVIKGDGGLFFRAYSAGHAAVMPLTNQPINLLEATFEAKVGNGSDAADKIQIGVADANGENIEWLDTLYDATQSRGDFTEFTYRFDQYDGNGRRIAFSNVNQINNWMLIDNLTVRLIPQCIVPDNVRPNNMVNPDSTYFTWTSTSEGSQWQVVLGDYTDEIDDIASSAVTVEEESYVIPAGTLTMGHKYSFYIRTLCSDNSESEWYRYDFTAGTVLLPTSGSDTVSGCGLVVYDNGGPNGGYVTSETTVLVVRPAEVGSLVVIDSGWVHTYQGGSTLTIYDGEGTDGTELYSTTEAASIPGPIVGDEGAVTFRFAAGMYVATGFEIFTHCIDGPTCLRPKNVAVEAQTETATVSWTTGNAVSTGGSYTLYYREKGTSEWLETSSDQEATGTLTGLAANTLYEVRVMGICSGNDSSLVSSTVQFRTACPGDTCTLQVAVEEYGSSATVIQNGHAFGTYEYSYYGTNEVKVCSDHQLDLLVSGSVTITNEADIEVYVGQDVATTDTIHAGQPCPDCMPVTGLALDANAELTATSATFSWTAGSEETSWVVYLDGERIETVEANTYTLNNLDANTEYTFGVRAYCGEEDTSVVRYVNFRTACANGNCEFTVEATDSRSDGWDGGAAIYVYQNGEQVGSLRLEGYTGQGTLEASHCLGESIELKWHTGGNYDNEIGFTILDANGDMVVSVSDASTLADEQLIATFSETCEGTAAVSSDCPAPTSLAATNVTTTTATLNWNANTGTLFEVTYDGITEQVSANTYELTGLTPGTEYTVSVVTVCDDDLVSNPATVSFTTTGTDGIDQANASSLVLYPNPASGSVTLSLGGMEQAEVTLIDLSGREVMRTRAEGSTHVLNLDGVGSGTYFVRVVSSQTTAVSKLTVK